MSNQAAQDAYAMGVLADAIRDADLTGGIYLLSQLWRDGYEKGLAAAKQGEGSKELRTED